ncbi:hypothetical protein CLV63_11957 [Murinocardiopsis flavida]|uniref:Kinase n=1 Tax=Murinocardiopsis flavida TaxID=645275 RepID=A0A2P8D3K7_9ACTN|nr:AAA family ATPase [Murinocardiopsis flavida]PSK91776.1 hypothetical protein CLV63_11957 [Murinocardiopsis flavida]
MPTGSEETRLIVLRGNSASGKSTVAQAVRGRYGYGLAVVAQDNIRRTVLREKDVPGGVNIGLIDHVARYALDSSYHVVVEGIMHAERYAPMLERLCDDHRGLSRCYYFDLRFDETLRRHAGRPLAAEVDEEQMREWYRPGDLLPGEREQVIAADATEAETVARIMADAGWDTR